MIRSLRLLTSRLTRAIYGRWVALPEELVRTQILSVSRGFPFTFAMSVIVSIGMLAMSHEPDHLPIRSAAFALHLGILSGFLVRYVRQQKRGWHVASSRHAIHLSAAQGCLAAFGWMVFLGTCGLGAADHQLIVVVAVIAGVTAVGALRYAALPPASLAFLVTANLVSFFFAILWNLPTGMSVFLGAYILLLGRFVLEQSTLVAQQYELGQARAAAEHERDLLRAEAQREEWQRQAAAAEARTRMEAASRCARDGEVRRIAGQFEQIFVRNVTDLAAAADRTRQSAELLVRAHRAGSGSRHRRPCQQGR